MVKTESKHQVEVFPDAASLAQAAAQRFAKLAHEAIQSRSSFSVALSGGSTPRELYARIADGEKSSPIDWSSVQLFWGDERCVPPDHIDSNYRMAVETLISRVPIPHANVHRIKGEMNPGQAAEEYEETLRRAFGLTKSQQPAAAVEHLPRFDLILLGMGADGHTASLFPHSEAIHEKRRWAAAQYIESQRGWRITLTPGVINAARQVVFLVSGTTKAERLFEVLYNPIQPEILPAQIVRPLDGQLTWMLDSSAAAKL